MRAELRGGRSLRSDFRCLSILTHISMASSLTPTASRSLRVRVRLECKPWSPSEMAMDLRNSMREFSWPSNIRSCTRPSAFILTKRGWPRNMRTVEMERLARHPKVIAWGEIGLDYYYDHSPRDTQKEVFLRQMELAAAAKLPIVIHCRPSDDSENAWEDCLQLIEDQWAPNGIGGILHCFTGNMGPCQTGTRCGIHDFVCRKSNLPQGATDSRCCTRGSARAAPHRDGLPLSCSHPLSREAQRTCVCEGDGSQLGDVARNVDGGNGRADFPQFLQFFQNI